ncbi:dihydrodipicolinate synthase family protein [Luteitalea sp.]
MQAHPSVTEAAGPPSLTGLFSAAVTPRTESGAVDHDAFDRVLDLLLAAGVDGVCLGGATAEYPHATREERLDLIERTMARIGDKAVLVGIGAAAPTDVVPLGRAALDAGARAVLLSMPLFFRYAQEDLEAFCLETAATLGGPVLLYDLPSFTTPFSTETILRLLNGAPHVIGIKDSSGQSDRLGQLAHARGDRPWRLLVGDDGLLVEAMAEGWDGCISGTSGAFPELMVAVTRAARARDEAMLAVLVPLLRELFAQQGVFPTPWAIRIGLEARGIPVGPLPLPVSPGRQAQRTAFVQWVPGWLTRVEQALGLTLVGAR